jgi:hypothetical protein
MREKWERSKLGLIRASMKTQKSPFLTPSSVEIEIYAGYVFCLSSQNLKNFHTLWGCWHSEHFLLELFLWHSSLSFQANMFLSMYTIFDSLGICSFKCTMSLACPEFSSPSLQVDKLIHSPVFTTMCQWLLKDTKPLAHIFQVLITHLHPVELPSQHDV